MTTKEVAAILQKVLPAGVPFAIQGRMAVMMPVSGILRAIKFEKTRDKNRSDILYFVLPLCKPTANVYFSYGKFLRENGRQDWLLVQTDLIERLGSRIRTEAIPFLQSLNSHSALAELLLTLPRPGINPEGLQRTHETLGYLFARMGDVECAKMHFARMSVLIKRDRILADWALNPKLAWVREMKERAAFLGSLLDDAPEGAQKQLDMWEDETARNLDIEKWRCLG
jgi:hypothetical protein